MCRHLLCLYVAHKRSLLLSHQFPTISKFQKGAHSWVFYPTTAYIDALWFCFLCLTQLTLKRKSLIQRARLPRLGVKISTRYRLRLQGPKKHQTLTQTLRAIADFFY